MLLNYPVSTLLLIRGHAKIAAGKERWPSEPVRYVGALNDANICFILVGL